MDWVGSTYQGVEDKEASDFYLGKRIAYIYKVRKDRKETRFGSRGGGALQGEVLFLVGYLVGSGQL